MESKTIKEKYTDFSWQVFLEALAKSEIGKTQKEIEQDLWELFPLANERIH